MNPVLNKSYRIQSHVQSIPKLDIMGCLKETRNKVIGKRLQWSIIYKWSILVIKIRSILSTVLASILQNP